MSQIINLFIVVALQLVGEPSGQKPEAPELIASDPCEALTQGEEIFISSEQAVIAALKQQPVAIKSQFEKSDVYTAREKERKASISNRNPYFVLKFPVQFHSYDADRELILMKNAQLGYGLCEFEIFCTEVATNLKGVRHIDVTMISMNEFEAELPFELKSAVRNAMRMAFRSSSQAAMELSSKRSIDMILVFKPSAPFYASTQDGIITKHFISGAFQCAVLKDGVGAHASDLLFPNSPWIVSRI